MTGLSSPHYNHSIIEDMFKDGYKSICEVQPRLQNIMKMHASS